MPAPRCDGEVVLNGKDVEAIHEIEEQYYNPEFIYGNNPAYTTKVKRRIEGVGEFEAKMELRDGIVKKINLAGDFFIIGDIDNALLVPLIGVELTREALEKRLADTDVESIILKLSKQQFINFLLDK